MVERGPMTTPRAGGSWVRREQPAGEKQASGSSALPGSTASFSPRSPRSAAAASARRCGGKWTAGSIISFELWSGAGGTGTAASAEFYENVRHSDTGNRRAFRAISTSYSAKNYRWRVRWPPCMRLRSKKHPARHAKWSRSPIARFEMEQRGDFPQRSLCRHGALCGILRKWKLGLHRAEQRQLSAHNVPTSRSVAFGRSKRGVQFEERHRPRNEDWIVLPTCDPGIYNV